MRNFYLTIHNVSPSDIMPTCKQIDANARLITYIKEDNICLVLITFKPEISSLREFFPNATTIETFASEALPFIAIKL